MMSKILSNLIQSAICRVIAFLIVGVWIGGFLTFTSVANGVIFYAITFALAGVSWQLANALETSALIEIIEAVKG